MKENDTSASSINEISDGSYTGESKNFIIDFNNFASQKIANLNFNKKEEENKSFFSCYRWQHTIPIILFIGNLIEITCECGTKEKLTYEEAYKRFFFNDKNLKKDHCYKCEKEGHSKKKYEYYCFKCKENL